MVNKSKAIERLTVLLKTIEALSSPDADDREFMKWHEDVKSAIKYMFGDRSDEMQTFLRIKYRALSSRRRRANHRDAYLNGLKASDALISSFVDRITHYWEDNGRATRPDENSEVVGFFDSNQVFVVHGRDQGALAEVKQFLGQLGVEPVILQELPNQGRTIIEKFEDHSHVGFAVVLCTPDDDGGLASEDAERLPRARQNVVFEWGFFIGKLGRDRVCALIKGDVEIPSDYSGVLYVEMDERGAWRLDLAKELKEAQYAVDLNNLQ